jgi:hypothetical protein
LSPNHKDPAAKLLTLFDHRGAMNGFSEEHKVTLFMQIPYLPSSIAFYILNMFDYGGASHTWKEDSKVELVQEFYSFTNLLREVYASSYFDTRNPLFVHSDIERLEKYLLLSLLNPRFLSAFSEENKIGFVRSFLGNVSADKGLTHENTKEVIKFMGSVLFYFTEKTMSAINKRARSLAMWVHLPQDMIDERLHRMQHLYRFVTTSSAEVAESVKRRAPSPQVLSRSSVSLSLPTSVSCQLLISRVPSKTFKNMQLIHHFIAYLITLDAEDDDSEDSDVETDDFRVVDRVQELDLNTDV